MPDSFDPERERPTGSSRFVKVSRDADQDERIQREAALLKILRHPGIVPYIDADTAAFPNVLITERIDGPSLAEAGHLPADEVERLMTAVGATLSDLHRVGVVHGAIAPEHVLLRSDGQAVLCSFGYSGRVGDPPWPLPPGLAGFAHPQRAETGLTPEIDRYALDEIKRVLVKPPTVPSSAPPSLEGLIRRHAGPEPGRRQRAGGLVAALGAAALLLAVGSWGLSRQTGTTTPGQRAADTTTVPVPPVDRGRPGPTIPAGDRDTASPETTSRASAPEETSPSSDGTGDRDSPGIGRPTDSSSSDLMFAFLEVPGGAAPAEGGAWETSASEPAEGARADAASPWPLSAPADTAPRSLVPSSREPTPAAVPPRARAANQGQSAGSATEGSAPLPVASTWPPPLSLPSPAELAPQVSLPPPETLPSEVSLPDPATLARPVELPEESTLLPASLPVH